MNITADNLESTLNYILELIIILYISKNILLIPLAGAKKRYIALALSSVWLLYTLLAAFPLPNTFVILPVSLLVFAERPALISFTVISETLAINIITLISFYSYCMISHTKYNSSSHEYNDLITGIIIFCIITQLRKKFSFTINFLKEIQIKHFVLIFCVILVDFFLSLVSGLLFFQNINQLGRRLLVLAIYTMIVLSIVILILYFRIVHIHSELEQLSNIKSKMLSLEEKHYKDMLQKNTDLRAFRHDYNYHITAMQALAQNDDFDALKAYVNQLTTIKAKIYFISTNNTIADAIINYFYEILPDNTSFKVDGKFSYDTFISNDDLCIILSNLLKNAYEALRLINTDTFSLHTDTDNNTAETEKKLYISISNDENNITLYIMNTCKPYEKQSGSIFSTSKSDTLNHGFGLKNVADTVEKYDGKLELKTENSTFSAYVFLHNIT